jgi:hypothetical protein
MDHQAFAQLLGNYGELIGAVAVVLTLVYLTLQVRQNTAAMRQQSHNDVLRRRNDWFNPLIQDRGLTNLMSLGLNGERFDEVDALRFTYLMINNLGNLQDCFYQHRAGIIDESVWKADVRIVSAGFLLPGMQGWWQQSQQFFTAEFVAAIDAEIEPVDLVLYDPNTSTWFKGGRLPTA